MSYPMRSTVEANRTSISTSLAPLAVLGAALGLVVALVCVALLWMTGFGINGAFVGGIAGAVAGAATAILGAPDRIQ